MAEHNTSCHSWSALSGEACIAHYPVLGRDPMQDSGWQFPLSHGFAGSLAALCLLAMLAWGSTEARDLRNSWCTVPPHWQLCLDPCIPVPLHWDSHITVPTSWDMYQIPHHLSPCPLLSLSLPLLLFPRSMDEVALKLPQPRDSRESSRGRQGREEGKGREGDMPLSMEGKGCGFLQALGT